MPNVVASQKNCLCETILLSRYNICWYVKTEGFQKCTIFSGPVQLIGNCKKPIYPSITRLQIRDLQVIRKHHSANDTHF